MARLSVRQYDKDEFDADYYRLPPKAKERFNAFTTQVSDTENTSLAPLTTTKNGRLEYEFFEGCFVYWRVVTEADVVNGKVIARPVAIQILDIEQI
jgi:hypothetical protein